MFLLYDREGKPGKQSHDSRRFCCFDPLLRVENLMCNLFLFYQNVCIKIAGDRNSIPSREKKLIMTKSDYYSVLLV